MNTNTRGTTLLAVVVALVIVLGVVVPATVIVLRKETSPAKTNGNSAQCTLEAKLCPDGSSVGRSGPNCEFAACPTTNTNQFTTNENVNVQVSNINAANINSAATNGSIIYSSGGYAVEEYAGIDGYSDTRLLKQSDNAATVLIESTKEATQGATLIAFSFPETGTRLYFAEGALGTDSGRGKLWVFDTQSRLLSPLTSINQTIGEIGWGGVTLDNENNRVAHAPGVLDDEGFSTKLYFLDLVHDEGKLLVQLEGNETLNRRWGALSNSFDIQWKNENTIQYTVYDQSSVEPFKGDKAVIEVREVSIP